jgi:hypothetical protein
MYVALICNDVQLSAVVLSSLNANGIQPLLICNRRCYAIFRASKGTRGVITAGDVVTESAKVIEAIRQYDAVHCIDQLLAADIVGLKVLDDIRNEVAPSIYPMPHRELLETLNDRACFHQLLTHLGLAVPISRAYPCLRSVDIDAVSQKIGFPLVIKPVSTYPRIGPMVVMDKAGLLDACTSQSNSYGPVILQQFIAGSDVGISVFARAGNAVVVSTFFCGPKAAADFVEIPALAAIARKIIRVTTYDGVANFEARIDRAGRLWILECYPGFSVHLTANRLCGLDLLTLGLPVASSTSPAPTGCYYPPAQIASREAIRKLIVGELRIRVVMRSLAEILRDPGPAIMRGIDPVLMRVADWTKSSVSKKLPNALLPTIEVSQNMAHLVAQTIRQKCEGLVSRYNSAFHHPRGSAAEIPGGPTPRQENVRQFSSATKAHECERKTPDHRSDTPSIPNPASGASMEMRWLSEYPWV